MLIEKIKTPGLAHLSYIVGSGGEAAVIDPRRDCEIYVEKAREEGLRITHILETHRNEDLISGAPVLAALTGAEVWHGPNPADEIVYAKTVREGDCAMLGQLKVQVMETPGHTDDHLAYALFDDEYPDSAVGVFTGDALFVGDVGRTDFYPERAREVAGLLYDSLHKILDLGDQAIVWPAHGAGSVCGSGMADREASSVGHERLNNPRLQLGREDFIAAKLAETHYLPPYFALMERLNSEGGEAADRVSYPRPLTLGELDDCGADHVIDLREPPAYCAAHLPGSFCLPVDMVSAFAGWFVRERESVALVASDEAQLRKAAVHLARIGLDNILGGYTGVIPAAAKGHEMGQIAMIETDEVEARLERGQAGWTLIDVRAEDEVAKAAIEGSRHIYAGHLNQEWRDLDKGGRYTLMCASGMRATIAASWLASKGFDHVDVYLGSMGAWKAAHSGD